MKELIKNNVSLIERILTNKGVSCEDVESLISLEGLEDNINRKNLQVQKKNDGWQFSFMFSTPIKTKREFKNYLKKNDIKNYELVEKVEYICEDFRINLTPHVKAYFYNPRQ